MHNNFFSGWKTSYSARSSDTQLHQEYYNRIEESLNLAIKGCADAISYELGYEPINEEDDISFISDFGWILFSFIIVSTIGIIVHKKNYVYRN